MIFRTIVVPVLALISFFILGLILIFWKKKVFNKRCQQRFLSVLWNLIFKCIPYIVSLLKKCQFFVGETITLGSPFVGRRRCLLSWSYFDDIIAYCVMSCSASVLVFQFTYSTWVAFMKCIFFAIRKMVLQWQEIYLL